MWHSQKIYILSNSEAHFPGNRLLIHLLELVDGTLPAHPLHPVGTGNGRVLLVLTVNEDLLHRLLPLELVLLFAFLRLLHLLELLIEPGLLH